MKKVPHFSPSTKFFTTWVQSFLTLRSSPSTPHPRDSLESKILACVSFYCYQHASFVHEPLHKFSEAVKFSLSPSILKVL